MATNIQIFNNPEFGDVRTIIKEDGTLLFVASDVAKSLGYAVPQKAVIDHCKHCSKMEHPSNKGTYINLIPESDLYRLTMKSKLPRAEKFQDWVCEEVIPSIRKTGSYSVQPKTPQTYLEALEALVEAEKEKQRLELESKQQQAVIEQKQVIIEQKEAEISIKDGKIEILEPKGESYDAIMSSQGLVTINMIAAFLGISARKLNQLLCQWGVQYKQSKCYFLTYKYRDKGYTKHVPFPYLDNGVQKSREHMYWTEAGRKFVIDLYNSKTAA